MSLPGYWSWAAEAAEGSGMEVVAALARWFILQEFN
jgi:hypothetical protein